MEKKLSSMVGEDDSTDIGSSLSDADISQSTFNSPCCTDTETENERMRKVLELARLHKPPGLPSPTQKASKAKDISPPIFATECPDDSKRNAQPKYRKDSFNAPPGLPSPARRRRTRTAIEFQSMLATMPSPSSEVSCLPSSPNRRARLAIIEKAKRDGLPVKVESQVGHDHATVPLNPALPAKKKLPFLDDLPISDQSMRSLKPGVPAKKRVSPWLLQSADSTVKVTPR
jgi:hypothetical protein